MKKSLAKTLALMLALVMSSAALASCAGTTTSDPTTTTSTNATTQPAEESPDDETEEVTEDETEDETEATSEETDGETETDIEPSPLDGDKPALKILSMYQAYNYEEQPSHKLLEEITGYETNWFALPQENSIERLLLDISSGEDYDILLNMGQGAYAQLSSQGALIPINDMLDQYGQNIKNSVSEFAWQSVTDTDGVINAIPRENMVASPSDPYGMFTGGIGVRDDLMVEAGLELPTTLDEFTEFLRTAQSELGGSPLTANQHSIFNPAIMMAFNMGSPEWYNIDGVYTHRIKHPEMVDYLAYMQTLYQEKLLDNDMPINTADNAREKFASANSLALAPMMFWDIPMMVNALETSNPDAQVEFISGLHPDANTQGINYIMRQANFISVFSVHSPNPEHALNWLDILSEPSNFARVYVGEEGVSYEMIDGSYWPIFSGEEGDFDYYTNSDKFAGVSDPTVAFQMWQARARKTPEMAVAFEAMNAHVDEYDVRYNIEMYGKVQPIVQEYTAVLGQEFGDAFIKAVVDGTDPQAAMDDMRATWDANGGLIMEEHMQNYYDANKHLEDG